MTDYRWNFPTSGLARALECMSKLPCNALGDRRDAQGNVVVPTPQDDPTKIAPDATAWIGRQGSAATMIEGMDGKSIEIAAKGDPAKYYVHVRTDEVLDIDPAAYGMSETSAEESAAVLGVWAGDAL